MPTPAILANFDGNLNYDDTGSGGVGTGYGAIRYARKPIHLDYPNESKNWCANPSFEASTSHWITGESTVTRVADASAPDGAYVGRWTFTNVTFVPYLWYGATHTLATPERISVSKGQTIRVRVLVRGVGTGVGRMLGIQFNLSSSTGAGLGAITPNGYQAVGSDWTAFESSYTFDSNDVSYCRVMLRTESIGPTIAVGDQFDVDAIDIRVNDPLDDFFTGATYGSNYQWLGTPHLSQSVRQWQGRSLIVEEPTTNLHTNPELAVNSTGWTGFATTPAFMTNARVTDQTDMGVASWRSTFSGTTGTLWPYFQTSVPAVASSDSYTPSCTMKYTRPITVSVHTRINYADTTFTEIVGPAFTLGVIPQRVVFPTITADPAKTTTFISGFVRLTGIAQVNDQIWMSKGQIEKKDHATTYARGNMGTGYAFTGTADASTTTRAESYFELPMADDLESLVVRYSTDGTTYDTVEDWSSSVGSFGNTFAEWTGTDLEVYSDRIAYVDALFGFSDRIYEPEVTALENDDTWEWEQFDTPPLYVPLPVVVPTFATAQEALDATYTQTRQTVYIGGIITDVNSYSTQHRVGQTATATIELTLPVGDHVVPNAEVEIWDGHNNLMGRRFWGRLPAWTRRMDNSGNTMVLKPRGWSSLLGYQERFDMVFTGPITLRAIFDSVCSTRGVPSYRADAVLDDTGTIEVILGGNPYIEEGTITIPASQSPLAWLNAAAEPFGYRVYDDLLGTVRLSRLSGMPSGTPVVTFEESTNLLSGTHDFDATEIVNYWEVEGPTYEDEIGRSVPIRAIPAGVPSDPLIPVNDGINFRSYRSSLLVTQQLAEIVRRRLEIDNEDPQEPIRWTSIAVPSVGPGDTVAIYSETLDSSQDFWLLGVDVQSSVDNGLTASYEGWAGSGEALPAGVDRIEIPLQTSAVHIGDENVPWYAHPAPQGLEYSWDFTIPKRATAVNVIFRVHGSNSQFIGGENEDLTVSKFELWRLPIEDPEEDKPHSSGTLPVLDENYAQRYKYATDDTKWSPGAIALKGFDDDLVNVRLKLISGENSEATAGPQDDFEVKNVLVEIYGTVEPVILPTEVTP